MTSIDHDRRGGKPPIPVTVLTGFLGAGKTTLLNHILNGSHGVRVAVLVNDFGSINIDAELVVSVAGEVISLANGCVCCSIRDDLITTVFETLERPEQPEYILLEASGVADPAGIAMTFNNPAFRDRIRLDGILCLVDAEQVFAAPETMELKIFQMACADLVILNKVDLVDRERIARIKAWLDDRFHRYRLVETVRAAVPLPILSSVGRLDAVAKDGLPHRDHDHKAFGAPYSTWSYETDVPLSLERLRDAIAKLPSDVYRVKGVILSAEAPDRRAVLQVVGRRADIALEGDWGGCAPRTRIVAIGAVGANGEPRMREALDRCVAAGMAAGSDP